MTRLRYVLNNDGMLVSSKPMVAGHDSVMVTINPKTKSYVITSYDTATVIAQSKEYETLTSVKVAVKGALKLMGVVFDDEIRAKKAQVTN